MKKFSAIDWRLRFLQLMILLIPFSYQPRIFLSRLEGLNLEFSLVQISAAIFVLLSLQSIYTHAKKLSSILAIKLLAIFVIFNWLTILWSADAVRTIVLSTYWTFLLMLVLSIVVLFMDKKIKQSNISNPLIIGTIIGVIFGWLQFKGVMFGVSDSLTLIDEKYNAELFGFARIQAFALEPQFYANALIAPVAYLSWRFLFSKYQTYHLLLLAWFFATFLLTVSRGGTLGLIATLGFMVFWFVKSQSKDVTKKIAQLAGVLMAGFLISLAAVYISATIHPDHDGLASVEIFVDQMSNGVIDIKLANGGLGVEGYVESSTTGRLFMVERALEITAMSPANYFIGIGAGSFGPVYQQEFNSKISNHVVNNQYVEFLTELGIIGLVLFLAFVTVFGKTVWQNTKAYKVLFIGLLLAYLVQYCFFSLQTNVMHIWLFVGIVLGVSVMKKKAKA